MVTSVRRAQPAKADTPILTTVAGMCTDLRTEQHDPYALSAMNVALGDIIALPASSTISPHSTGAGEGDTTGGDTGGLRVGWPVGSPVGSSVGLAGVPAGVGEQPTFVTTIGAVCVPRSGAYVTPTGTTTSIPKESPSKALSAMIAVLGHSTVAKAKDGQDANAWLPTLVTEAGIVMLRNAVP